MGRLDHLSVDDLHAQLERTVGKIPTQRVLVAIGRKQGASLEELAERHDVVEKTVRNWLDRFEEQSLKEAPYDENRPGRPPELSGHEKTAFVADLHRSPEDFGYDGKHWHPGMMRRHLAEEYGVEYSVRHVYRLLDDAGVTYDSGQRTRSRGDADDDTDIRDDWEDS